MAVDEDGEPQRRGHVGTFGWFSPDSRYGLKAAHFVSVSS